VCFEKARNDSIGDEFDARVGDQDKVGCGKGGNETVPEAWIRHP
jgi:hypothetical protein